MIQDLEDAARQLRAMKYRREAERRAARFRPDGKLAPKSPHNRSIAEAALVREPMRDSNAEVWITYSGARRELQELAKTAFQANESLKAMPEAFQALTEIFEQRTLEADALNGYVAFPKRRAPQLPDGTGSLLKFIPVHGGITWACKDAYAAVWGFDTMHHNSEKEPRTDRDWIRAQCLVLYRGLMLAEELWPEYRRASDERRLELAQQLLDLIPEQPLVDKLGFEGLCGLLTGNIE